MLSQCGFEYIGECKLNDIGRETNTLISEMTTVICLDDFHSNDRAGRKVSGKQTHVNLYVHNFTGMFIKTHMRIDSYLYHSMLKYYSISAKHVNIYALTCTVIFIQTYMRIDLFVLHYIQVILDGRLSAFMFFFFLLSTQRPCRAMSCVTYLSRLCT